jgi:translation initiation factor IF-3
LDLVEVAPNANPPVCRIMDFGKFKFDEAQRAKESRRKATSSSIKEMKYRPKIGVGDFDTKTRQVTKFLSEGHKVKITIMFRGREMSHPELGKKLLDHVAVQVGAIAKIEAAPKLDGRNMIMVLAPDRRAAATTQAPTPARPAAPRLAGRPETAPAETAPAETASNGPTPATPAPSGPTAAPTTTTAPTATTPTTPPTTTAPTRIAQAPPPPNGHAPATPAPATGAASAAGAAEEI